MTSGTRKRSFVVLAVLAAVAGAIASFLWAGRVNAAQQDERAQLDLYLDASSAGWAEVTKRFFSVPEATAQTISGLRVAQTDKADEQDTIALLAESIRAVPELDAAFIGGLDGSFLFVAKTDDEVEGGFRIRSITGEGAERRVELSWTDASLQVLRSEIDPEDTYDPRVRPWFGPIAEGAATAWTDPYVFSSSQQPGITHSAAVFDDAGAVVAVVGIDIRLTDLSEFLNALRPGANGEALVVSRAGTVIAASPMNLSEEALLRSGSIRPLQESPDLFELVDRIADQGPSAIARTGDGVRTTVARPVGAGNDWYLASRAYDQDFLGSAATEPVKNLAGVLGMGIASAAIVALVGFLSLRHLWRVKEEADLDELTGLMSRRATQRALSSRLQAGSPVTTAIIDLDRFKEVNDGHGHAEGDLVLVAVASRIGLFAEQNQAMAGRLGGDEFVMVSEHGLAWGQLIAAIGEPITVRGNEFSIGASIGVAKTDDGARPSIEDVLGVADHALFAVKRDGGGRFEERIA